MENKKIEKILLLRVGSDIISNTMHPKHFSPPFTLKYIQSLLEREYKYRSRLIDCLADPLSLVRLYKETTEFNPDVVVILGSSITYNEILDYAKFLREKLCCLILGIGQVTLPNFSIDKGAEILFDFLLPGEAEQEFMFLLNRLESGENTDDLRKYYYNKWKANTLNLVQDLDNLPFPKYSDMELRLYHFIYPLKIFKRAVWGHILSSRGCPNECIFCSPITRETYGKEFRYRSAPNVIDEIELLLKSGVNIISFDDDNFTSSQEHVVAICREIILRKLKLRWIAHARINEVDSLLLKLMKEAGCILLRLGVESGSQRIIELLKKAGPHLNWNQRCREVFKELKNIGIASDALFIIGNPTETKAELKKTIELALELDSDLIQVHYFSPYFGSSAFERYSIMSKEINMDNLYHYDLPVINLSNMSNRDLNKARKIFYGRFIFRLHFILSHFFEYMPFYFLNPRTFFINCLKTMKVVFCKSI